MKTYIIINGTNATAIQAKNYELAQIKAEIIYPSGENFVRELTNAHDLATCIAVIVTKL